MLRMNPQPTLICASALLIGAAAIFPAAGRAQDFNKLNRFMQTAGTSDEAMKTFRRGRELLAQEEWARAAEQFGDFLKDHPRHKDTDAALYWLAFAQKKQGRLAQADGTLDLLLKEHPQSRWREDAEALRLELAPQLGKPEAINQAINKEDEELKLIALQSLFRSSPDRAAAVVTDLLRPGSQANQRLKEAALMLAAQHGNEQTTTLLIQLARNEADAKLRKQAVFWLSQVDGAHPLLAELVRNEEEKQEVRKQAAFAIGVSKNPAALATLESLYAEVKSREVRKQIIFAASINGNHDEGRTNSEAGVDFLIRVAGSDPDRELKKQALFWLGQKAGERSRAVLGNIIESSDADTEVQKQAVFAISQRPKDEAVPMLIKIARTHAKPEVRKQAVFWLGQTGDERALAFFKEVLAK